MKHAGRLATFSLLAMTAITCAAQTVYKCESKPHGSIGRIPPARFAELHRQRAGDAARSTSNTTQID